MTERTVEDRLRREYFELLPDIRRVAAHLETDIKYCLLPISDTLDRHERLVVSSRIKDCESAVDKLRWKHEGGVFAESQPEVYSLASLHDLAGVRVMAFPPTRLAEVNRALRQRFPAWAPDPVLSDHHNKEPLAFKYHGHCETVSRKIFAEYQITSILIGLFWEVEHTAMYKPSPELKGVEENLRMRQRRRDVEEALRAFEKEFERVVRENALG